MLEVIVGTTEVAGCSVGYTTAALLYFIDVTTHQMIRTLFIGSFLNGFAASKNVFLEIGLLRNSFMNLVFVSSF